MTETKIKPPSYHRSAKELVVEAASQSGLLWDVAELLWFVNKYLGEDASHTAEVLLGRLIVAFEDQCTAGIVDQARVETEVPEVGLPSKEEEIEVKEFLG
jgi:hypothetical protein